MPIKWAYGLTAIPQRRESHLPQTLRSLTLAGFPAPHLFVDGEREASTWRREFGLEVTCRWPRIRSYGNWILGFGEVFIRNPTADLYAMFQDDFICCRNLRAYLEKSLERKSQRYWNLYTFPSNQELARGEGWYDSNQLGRGALALVFERETVVTLLTHQHMVERPLDPQFGWRKIDGGVVTCLKKAGVREVVHNPSLVQHTGLVSAIDKRVSSHGESERFPEYRWPARGFATSFRGEEYDALEMLK